MKRNVRVEISGTQTIDNESYTMLSFGEGIINLETGLLSFTEKQEDGGTVVNVVRIYPYRIDIKKNGQIKSDMSFEKSAETIGRYQTPFGEHKMSIFTKEIRVADSLNSAQIYLDYTLKMDGQIIGDTELTITANYFN